MLDRSPGERLAILAAHPDDETLGASTLLAGHRRCEVIHVTDGAPRDPRFRPRFEGGRVEYARARRRELHAALAVAGVSPARTHALGAADLEAVEALVPLARDLARLLERLGVEVLVTHAYEGAHPDHDAAAFIARGACGLLARSGRRAPRVTEMAVYHGAGGRLSSFEFLPSGAAPRTLVLTGEERRRKAAMLECFATQRTLLVEWFAAPSVERFRIAPPCDFTRAPHEGLLWYERLGFPTTGERWRAAASAAGAALERERLH